MTNKQKVLQQISRLKSFCESLDFECDTKSKTSNSVYFKKNDMRIRISDHFGFPNEKVISIVVCSENFRRFVLSCSDYVGELDSISEVKAFIKNYVRTVNILGNNVARRDAQIRTENNEMRRKINILTKELKKTTKYNRMLNPSNTKDGSSDSNDNKSNIVNFIINSNMTDKQKNSVLSQLKSFGAI